MCSQTSRALCTWPSPPKDCSRVWDWGGRPRRPEPAGDWDLGPGNWGPSLTFPLPQLRPWTRPQPLCVSASLWLTGRANLIWGILQNKHVKQTICIVNACVRACVLSRFIYVHLFATPMTPGSSVHGILQARILEWAAVPSEESSQPSGSNQSLLHW